MAKEEDLQVLYLIRKGNMNLKGEMESVFFAVGAIRETARCRTLVNVLRRRVRIRQAATIINDMIL